MTGPLRSGDSIGPFGVLGLPRSESGDGWPFRPPTSEEVGDITQYHVQDLGFDASTAIRHVDEEFLVVLDEFVPDDTDSYRGKVAIAFADHIHDWAIYYWPDGRVDILASSGSTL